MIEIDGSIGGGQVLRMAVGLSTLLQEPIKVINIRTNRKEAKPGLRPQHITGVKVLSQFSDAIVSGLEEGSTTVQFTPKKLQVDSKKIDIGTAGSITLLLQSLLPVLVFTKKPISLEIKGGTEVNWSPPVQYYQNVAFPLLRKLGAEIDLEVIKHGYYPKGGGIVKVNSKPVKKLRAWNCLSRGEIQSLLIDSTFGGFSKDFAKAQGEAAIRTLQYHYPNAKISMNFKTVETLSPGTSCTCYALCENSILGGSSLGERAVNPEIVGQEAAEDLVRSLKGQACLDKYMADQILPFLALAQGTSTVSVEGITEHVITNIKTIEKILPVKFQIKGKEISVQGMSWE